MASHERRWRQAGSGTHTTFRWRDGHSLSSRTPTGLQMLAVGGGDTEGRNGLTQSPHPGGKNPHEREFFCGGFALRAGPPQRPSNSRDLTSCYGGTAHAPAQGVMVAATCLATTFEKHRPRRTRLLVRGRASS